MKKKRSNNKSAKFTCENLHQPKNNKSKLDIFFLYFSPYYELTFQSQNRFYRKFHFKNFNYH